MDATVKGYLGQVVSTCVENISQYAGTPEPPAITDEYLFESDVSSILSSFFDKSLSANPDGSIEYIDVAYTTGGGTGGNRPGGGTGGTGGSDSFILSLKDPSVLLDKISDAIDIMGTTPDNTTFVLPSVSDFTLPEIPVYEPFSPGNLAIKTTNQWSSAYISKVSAAVSAILNGNVPLDSINKESEKLQYEIDLAIQQAFAQTAARGFRFPNSMTMTLSRDIYAKFFQRIESISAEFVQTVISFLTDAQKLGMQIESIQVDFTQHINELALAIVRFDIEQYTEKIQYAISKYVATVEKQKAKLIENRMLVLNASYSIKELILGIAADTQKNRLIADRTGNLIQFAESYKANNIDALQERSESKRIDIFDEKSKGQKEQSDIEASKKEYEVKSGLVRVNKSVLADKLRILESDISSYNQLAHIMTMEIAAADAERSRVSQEFLKKLEAYNALPTLLSASAKLLLSLSDNDVSIIKTT